MPNIPETQELQGILLDMQRKISRLEASVFVTATPDLTREELVDLYIDAIFEVPDFTDTSAKLWSACALSLNEVGVLRLGIEVLDPFPWRPFLFVLDAHTAKGYEILTERATRHLLELAENTIKLQGLWPLRPCDVIHTPTAIGQVLPPIS